MKYAAISNLTKSVVFSAAALLSLCAAVLLLSPLTIKKGPGEPAAVPVHVISVVQQDIARFSESLGSVASLHSVVLRPQINGVLTKLLVDEGQWVASGQLLATIDDRSIHARIDLGRAKLAENRARLNVAKINLARYQLLLAHDGISKQVYDQEQGLVTQLNAAILGDLAVVSAAEVELSYTEIRSPIAGRIGFRSVDVGNVLRTDDEEGLFSIIQINPIAVEFSLPQSMLPTLHKLLESSNPAVVKAYADAMSGNLIGEGKLTLINNQVTPATGTILAKAIFDNSAKKLWPGQSVAMRIQTALDPSVLVVPLGVVQRGLDGHFVYRVKDSTAEWVAVEVVHQDKLHATIKGVLAGDFLVSVGHSRLKPGSRLQIIDEPQHNTQNALLEPRS